jgi:hypothetical protein
VALPTAASSSASPAHVSPTGAAAAPRRRSRQPGFARRPVRSVDIGPLQDTFLISAVTMIIVIRLQLWVTNYPQLGGGKLHIAHLLWGGLFMLIAIGLLLSFLGRGWRRPAAVIGGIGFGFFVDELGKFVTSDNDYFFKPTAAMIYILFIVLYFVTRWMQTRRGFSDRENLFNAIDLFAEAARRDFDEHQKARALALLDRAGNGPLVEPLRALVRQTDAIPAPAPGRLRRTGERLRAWCFRVVEGRWFQRPLVWGLGLWAGVVFLSVLVLLTALGFKLAGADQVFRSDALDGPSIPNLASIVSSAATAGLIAVGIVKLRREDRVGGYRMLDRAMLIQIFITQVFVFVESSFAAVTGLLLSILLLVTIRHVERQEREAAAAPSTRVPVAGRGTRQPVTAQAD